jgi:hypothetical protein
MIYNNNKELTFFKIHSKYTRIRRNIILEKGKNIFNIIDQVIDLIHSTCIHESEKNLFNINHDKSYLIEVNFKTANDILNRILEKNNILNLNSNHLREKVFVNCRNAALIACSILREMKIPSRIRSGFMTYAYYPSKFKLDHVILEYWNYIENRWIKVDPLVSKKYFEKKKYPPNFNPLDLKNNEFISSYEAWNDCINNPNNTINYGSGIFKDQRGLFIVRNKLIHDLSYLNKTEVRPYDLWGYMLLSNLFDTSVKNEQIRDLNILSKIIESNDFRLIKKAWKSNINFKIPSIILSDFPKGNQIFIYALKG